MKKKTVLVVYTKEELEKVNYQLEYMHESLILDNGKFPRYFKIKKHGFKEIISENEDFLKDKRFFMVLPA